MKGKYLAACALIPAVALCGCAASRSVTADNTLRSGYPRFEMKVASDFLHAGSENKSEETMMGGRYNMGRRNTDRDYFVSADAEGNLHKFLLVETLSLLKGYWVFGTDNIPNKLEEEVITLGGKTYTAFTRFVELGCRPDAGEIERFLCGKGYVLPKCGLYRSALRVDGMDGEIMTIIGYFEDLKESVVPSCGSWVKKDFLLPGQLDHLKGFAERFSASFSMED